MGIHHLEFWVRDWRLSQPFYEELFRLVGWKQLSNHAFVKGQTEIYFVERPQIQKQDTLGPRHICLSASSEEVVHQVAKWLQEQQADVIRGPVEMEHYSPGYLTVDFRDPDGYIWEVAFTPNFVWE
ncbi:VOC family protein [Hazenella coriacea]|uniref:Catechol 2,3-dioxygenase-like lactoylglutathione lyase family enzyme n=1 Tax=Hazenella coriacea TaxID=1179467 RepID=A0A4R3L1K3_9BACL|nr:VOC family protein [Hazenella coriacea]TCS92355.1 catechol 2,3-dioxygenase-like lactoylglutathione lyase family enzyme [Hazenella coriacea]